VTSASEGQGAVRELFGSNADRYDARHYGSTYRTFIGDRQQLVTRVLRSQQLQPGARLLDVACGPGHFLQAAASMGADVVGIDSSVDMLRTSASRVGPGIPLVRGDGMALPFASSSFDLVNCSGLIEYIPEPMPLLREFLRVLRPGGTALVSSTNRRSPALALDSVIEASRRSGAVRRMVRGLGLPVDDVSLRARDFRMTFHTPAGLSTQMAEAGFEGLEMHYCHLQLFPHPLDHMVPAITTACVRATDRLLSFRPLRAMAEGLLAVGHRPGLAS
jgi:ubiquinone/menaquinone biosynthesis C-methylase UbiE